ncbi:hypothetical protein [Homoserinibacter sp. GY 40078]|uniref:hypothetical protein n=1 Tax=Homoserinibacter sp. GY 40078 TaxID=2603275 RepID=UPI0011CCA631|nr:hypothetical protein [Homoserinibacter sp. GY 40078]TXK18428.1 hypothetical protein FVQ89_00210 [Homoserinibacter sp. GY 40078]
MLKRSLAVGAVFGSVLALTLPFVGGAGPSLAQSAVAQGTDALPVAASSTYASSGRVGDTSAAAAIVTIGASTTSAASTVPASSSSSSAKDVEHLAQKPVPKPQPKSVSVPGTSTSSSTSARQAAHTAAGTSCPANVGGSTAGAPGRTSSGGVGGTTSADLAAFAKTFNAIRVANCLDPIPLRNIRYDSCLEARLFWIAEDPSPDVTSAWGHNGTKRSDGVPAVGCDGNLAGGSGNTGSTVATKWWNSAAHQKSLYRPSYSGSTSGVVICFAMVHGGLPNDGYSFTRAAARWGGC